MLTIEEDGKIMKIDLPVLERLFVDRFDKEKPENLLLFSYHTFP